jgi:hypothetical protein
MCSYLAMAWKDPAPPNDPNANETGTITVYERNDATNEYTQMCKLNITAGALDGEGSLSLLSPIMHRVFPQPKSLELNPTHPEPLSTLISLPCWPFHVCRDAAAGGHS